MDFSYRQEQNDARDLAGKIFSDYLSNEQLRKIEKRDPPRDPELWPKLAETGLLGVAIEERWGGMGLGFETLCLLVEEAGRRVAPEPLIPALVTSALLIQQFAPKEMRDQLLPPLASGELLVTAALAEPASENPARPTARATRDGAGDGWRIDGVKSCVPHVSDADHVILSAQCEGEPAWFVIQREDAARVEAQRSTANEPQGRITLQATPARQIAVGEQATRWIVERTVAAQCAFATGLCAEMLRMTAAYASEREQFGVKIATFQAVSHRAADCYIDAECLRLVTQQAVSLLDRGLEAAQEVQIAKVWCADVTHRVSFSSQHLHGGIGVDRDYELFRYCLWAKQLELSTGGGSARQLAALGAQIASQAKAAAVAD